VATPTIGELFARLEEQQARIERLEARSTAPAAGPGAGDPADGDPRPPGLTRRGMVRTAAAGAAGVVGAMLVESGGVASAATSGPASFTSSTSKPAVTATNTGKGEAVKGTAHKGIGVSGSSGSTAQGAAAVRGTITSTSPGVLSAGVLGVNNGTSGSGIGVYGSQGGSGWGVYGKAPSGIGVYGFTSTGTGVQGIVHSGGTGVYGQANDGTGVSGVAASGNAVQGSADTGTAVYGASSSGYGVFGNSPNNYAVVGATHSGNGVYGQVVVAPQAGLVGRTADSSGNWAVYGYGNIGATGTKSAVVPAEDGNGHLTLYCMESPECWFEDFGSARLSSGSASVRIDPEFAQTVDVGEYHVFLQAEGQCEGLIVEGKTAAGFAVREAGGGTSNVSFAYRIVARRKDVIAPRLNRVAMPNAPALIRADAPVPARPEVGEQGR
jgi:hypothetical protein